MKFTVNREPAAERRLAGIWVNATDQSSVTDAANRIDAELARNPVSAGESRTNRVRLLIEPPLAVYFTVHSAVREVTVWSVWRIR